MFVARFTSTPKNDVERGWSGYMCQFETDLETILSDLGHLDVALANEEEKGGLEARQQRWINTYGDRYEDWDLFYAEWLEELADEHSLVKDPRSGAWRPFHHDGLSCWALEATNEEDAMIEAQNAEIDWAGFGQATVGEIRLVGKVPACGDEIKDDYLYIFECEDVENEV